MEGCKLEPEKSIHTRKMAEQHVLVFRLSNRAVIQGLAAMVNIRLRFPFHIWIDIMTASTLSNPLSMPLLCQLNLVNCVWGSWQTWTSCTVTCGGGFQVRTRNIDTHEENSGTACSGASSEVQGCNTAGCVSGFFKSSIYVNCF